MHHTRDCRTNPGPRGDGDRDHRMIALPQGTRVQLRRRPQPAEQCTSVPRLRLALACRRGHRSAAAPDRPRWRHPWTGPSRTLPPTPSTPASSSSGAATVETGIFRLRRRRRAGPQDTAGAAGPADRHAAAAVGPCGRGPRLRSRGPGDRLARRADGGARSRAPGSSAPGPSTACVSRTSAMAADTRWTTFARTWGRTPRPRWPAAPLSRAQRHGCSSRRDGMPPARAPRPPRPLTARGARKRSACRSTRTAMWRGR